MADTQTIIAALADAFPTAKIGPGTVRVYVRALADIPAGELEPIAKAYMLEAQWFPTVRDLRRGVTEARLQLPGPDDAWEAALHWANQPATVACPAGCNRGIVPGEGVILDKELIADDSPYRGYLERIANAAAEPTALCPTCDGHGEIPNGDRQPLHDAVRRALDHVGGRAGILETDTPISVIRSQFLKAYERTREEALRTENLTSAGLQLEAAARLEIEGGTDG